MHSFSFWQEAWSGLRAKDRDALPSSPTVSPSDLLVEVEKQRMHAKGTPVTVAGEKLFIRDLLEKCTRWIKKFVEVGDVVVQYDPGHAALPWAALRIILQASLNNLDKHAALLEGVEHISRQILWSRMAEDIFLTVPHQAQVQLHQHFVHLYRNILVFLARSMRFLDKKTHRIMKGLLTSDDKFRQDLKNIAESEALIERYTSIIASQASVEQLNQMENVRRSLKEIKSPILRIEGMLNSTVEALTDNEWNDVLNWMSSIPYEKHFKTTVRKVLNGTGAWLFQDPEFLVWNNSSRSQTLRLYGSAGSGKSVLISMVVQSLIEQHQGHCTSHPLYFYCSRNTAEPERADSEQIVRSLARQAARRYAPPSLRDSLRQRYKQGGSAGHISIEEATDFLLQSTKDNPVTYILVDALDECARTDRPPLIEALKDIVDRSSSMVKIFVTSRDNHADINSLTEQFPEIQVNASRNQADIALYVQHKVHESIIRRRILPSERISKDLQQTIENTLRNGANGMFRWVELQLQYLCNLRVRSVLLTRLGKLPPQLEEIYRDLYEHNIKELGEDQAIVVRRVLSWLLISRRQLSTFELRQLACMGEDPDMTNETVLDICFNLVSLDAEQDQFRFSHLSVREFLEKRVEEFEPTELHDMATSSCLQLLMRQDRFVGTDDDRNRNWNSRNLNEDYASRFWPFHAEIASRVEKTPSCGQELAKFVFLKSEQFREWADAMQADDRYPVTTNSPQEKLQNALSFKYPELGLAASFGLTAQFSEMVTQTDGKEIFGMKNRSGNALIHLATQYGYHDIVLVMVENGAGVNERDKSNRCALHIACEYGHERIVLTLLRRGASINASDRFGGTALWTACWKGHDNIIRELINHGAKATTAVWTSTWEGYDNIIRGLISNGAKVTTAHKLNYRIPLIASIRHGNEEIISLLLKSGADANATNIYHENSLDVACGYEKWSVASLILKLGMHASEDNNFLSRALSMSVEAGQSKITRLILEHGADANPNGLDDVLLLACRRGLGQTIQMLFDFGANPDAATSANPRRPLSIAVEDENFEIIRILLKNGADVNMPSAAHVTPLAVAISTNNKDLVLKMLEEGAEVDPSCNACNHALRMAYHRANQEMLQMISETSEKKPWETVMRIESFKGEVHRSKHDGRRRTSEQPGPRKDSRPGYAPRDRHFFTVGMRERLNKLP